MTPSEKLTARLTPDLLAAARSNRRVRWVPGLGLILSWLVPLLVRWVIELLIARYGRAAGAIVSRWRVPLADLLQPPVLAGVDELLALCQQPLTTFDPGIRSVALSQPPVGQVWR